MSSSLNYTEKLFRKIPAVQYELLVTYYEDDKSPNATTIFYYGSKWLPPCPPRCRWPWGWRCAASRIWRPAPIRLFNISTTTCRWINIQAKIFYLNWKSMCCIVGGPRRNPQMPPSSPCPHRHWIKIKIIFKVEQRISDYLKIRLR